MKVWRILESLESLEDSMARFYDALRAHYTSDAEVAGFFARMRDEELSHRDIVRYQQRITFKSPENFLDLKDYDEVALDQNLRTVEDLIAREANLTLNDALRGAVAIESAATQQHYRSIIGRASPALGKLVQNLGTCDQDHAARLTSFARSHAESPSWWTA